MATQELRDRIIRHLFRVGGGGAVQIACGLDPIELDVVPVQSALDELVQAGLVKAEPLGKEPQYRDHLFYVLK